MTQQQQAHLERLGFHRTHTGKGLAGDRIWWKRIDTEMTIVRQRDGAEKRQDLAGNPNLPTNSLEANRQWAVELAADVLAEWQA